MLTIQNEREDGMAVTLARVHGAEASVPTIPAGSLVRIIGLAVDAAGSPALWAIDWHGAVYYCLCEELRPALAQELESHQEPCEDRPHGW